MDDFSQIIERVRPIEARNGSSERTHHKGHACDVGGS